MRWLIIPRTKFDITTVKINRNDVKILNKLKVGSQTNRDVLEIILKQYDKDGITRDLGKIIDTFQLFSNEYLHEDFELVLNFIRIICFKIISIDNQISKGLICNILVEDLEKIFNEKISEVISTPDS